MPTLIEILKKSNKINEIAKQLGFNEINVYKSATPGVLGIYGIFSKECPDQEWRSRCLALTYKISEVANCKVGVVSDKDDPDGSIRQTTIPFGDIVTTDFQKVFSSTAEEVIIDNGQDFTYQSSMRIYKTYYDKLCSSQPKGDRPSILVRSTSDPLSSSSSSSSSSSNPVVPFTEDDEQKREREREQSAQIQRKRKLSEVSNYVIDVLSHVSDDEFTQFMTLLQERRNRVKQNSSEKRPFTPLHSNIRKLNFPRIRKKILERFTAEQYDALKKDLDNYELTPQEKSAFFNQEGNCLLSFALISSEGSARLSFLYDHVPIDILKELLKNNDNYLLTTFLLTESGLEKGGFFNEDRQNHRIEKFKLLLKIDPENTQTFIKNNFSEEYMATNIKNAFEFALKTYLDAQPPSESVLGLS